MRKLIVAVLLLVFAAAASGDFIVKNIEYSAETGRVVATIHNDAPEAIGGPVVVRFYSDGQFIGEKTYLEGLPRYSTVSVYMNYEFSPGQHDVKVTVNADKVVEERSYGNNERDAGFEGKTLVVKPHVVSPDIPFEVEKNEGLKIEIPKEISDNIVYIITGVLAVFAVLAIANYMALKRAGRQKNKGENPYLH